MLDRIRKIKTGILILIILMILTACGGTNNDSIEQNDAQPTLSIEQVVALTVAAKEAGPALSVEQVVALTVAATGVEPALSVEQVVALTVAASNAQPAGNTNGSGNTGAPDVADPASGRSIRAHAARHRPPSLTPGTSPDLRR